MKELYAVVDDVLTHSRSKGTARLVMAGFAWHINLQTFESAPGFERLMRYANRSESTVERALRSLEAAEEIRKVRRACKGRAAIYQVLAGANARHPRNDGHSQTLDPSFSPSLSGSMPVTQGMTAQQNGKNNYPPDPPSSNGGARLDTIAPDLFETILRRLATDIGNGFIAHTMIEPLEQRGRRGDVLEVLAPDYCELELARRYGSRLTAIAREVLGERVDVEIVTASQLQRGGRARR